MFGFSYQHHIIYATITCVCKTYQSRLSLHSKNMHVHERVPISSMTLTCKHTQARTFPRILAYVTHMYSWRSHRRFRLTETKCELVNTGLILTKRSLTLVDINRDRNRVYDVSPYLIKLATRLRFSKIKLIKRIQKWIHNYDLQNNDREFVSELFAC